MYITKHIHTCSCTEINLRVKGETFYICVDSKHNFILMNVIKFLSNEFTTLYSLPSDDESSCAWLPNPQRPKAQVKYLGFMLCVSFWDFRLDVIFYFVLHYAGLFMSQYLCTAIKFAYYSLSSVSIYSSHFIVVVLFQYSTKFYASQFTCINKGIVINCYLVYLE